MPESTTNPDEAFVLWYIDSASILVTGRTHAQALSLASGFYASGSAPARNRGTDAGGG